MSRAGHGALLPWAMGALTLAFWLSGRPYRGLDDDARLYSLQAMARLHPESLGQDVFLAFGSQDTFTLFSPVYAFFIGLLGLETAAKLLTVAGQLWWLVAFFAVARTLTGSRTAWLATAIVAALPGSYGAWGVFQFAESFLSPRVFSEAAVLTAILAVLHGRAFIGVALSVLALAIHPLMGAGGAVVVATMLLPPERRWLTPAAVLGGLSAACGMALYWHNGPLVVIDEAWLELIRARAPFLFLEGWNEDAWKTVLFTLGAVLMLGSAWPAGNGRSLFRVTALTGVLGLAITLVGASVFRVALLVQGQGWRWVWISAALLAVAALRGVPLAWAGGPVARSAVLFLGASWLTSGWPGVALLAVAMLLWALRHRSTRPATGRGLVLASWSIFATSAVAWLTLFPDMPAHPAGTPLADRFHDWSRYLNRDGIGFIVAAVLTLVLMHTGMRALSLAIAGIATTAATVALAGFTPGLLQSDYQAVDPRTLDLWKATVPPSAEVFWIDDPAAAWFVLERRLYISADQTAGVVFSRTAAMEMLRRTRQTQAILSPALAFGSMSGARSWAVNTKSVREVCSSPEVDFVVARQRLALAQAAPPLLLPDLSAGAVEPVHLYDCRVIASAT